MAVSRRLSQPRRSHVIPLVSLVRYVAAWPLAAQNASTGAVAGHVHDPAGRALAGAIVVVRDAGASAISDQRGYFRIAGLSPGGHTLVVRYIGYAADTL